ncbi:zinc finger FYVE domain-containing protein 26 homolog [Sabethes cyaneus]|uniref:zinc finger FYVE domain-containing protein 26 homolog n=1 Tax=Sabethes cyaneus TaxID=53552 RepID=UPI00237DD944|nr:zinc finger FYVE domain-containing protein 26 homolog [Sabethes cyaneus]
MDRFNEYWELLSDKSVPIGKELITYYKTLHENEDGASLSERSCSFLLQNLLVNPYPTCQLLRLLATSKIPYKNHVIREICDAGIVDFLEGYAEDDVDKFYNLISNSLLSTDAMNKLVPKVLSLLEERKVDRELLLLALLSRKSQKLLKQFLKQMPVAPEMQYLLGVIVEKRHFLKDVIVAAEIPFHDPAIRSYIRFFQLIKQFNVGTTEGFVRLDPEPQVSMNNALTMYGLEMKRTLVLRDLLGESDNVLRIEEYAKEKSVIEIFLKENRKITPSCYEQILACINENDKLNDEINKLCFPNETESAESEDLKCLYTFMLWQYIVDVMKLSPCVKSFESVLESRITSIKGILKSVDSLNMFVDLLENVIILLFIRHEHFLQKSHGSIGFVCSDRVLETILNSLKVLTLTKRHAANYTKASDELKIRIDNCMDIINDALWRLSLFTGLISETPSLPQLVDIDYSNIAVKRQDSLSGQDENVFNSAESLPNYTHRNSTLPKRKHSRRRPYSWQLSSSGSTENKTMQQSLPLPCRIDTTVDPTITAMINKPKSIFSKMFGTPEKLATLCLVNRDLEAARMIIKNNQLFNSPIGQNLTFLESFTHIQERLSTLITNYNRMQQEKLSENGSMLEDIRARTAIGFEASKIIGTVETFSAGQQIQQSEEDLSLLRKYGSQYPFLKVFREELLRNIHAMDIILGLPMGYDLNLNLYNLISKSLEKTELEDGANLSYVTFLKRLIDDLKQFRNAGFASQSITLHGLLSSDVCPLDPNQLVPMLQKRRSLMTLKSAEDLRQQDQKSHWRTFAKIEKFQQGTKQLAKIFKSDMEAFTSEDAMKTDVSSLISRAAFENVLPLHTVESLAARTNSNLIHVIAQSFVVGIGQQSTFDGTNISDILNYVSRKNELLGLLLKELAAVENGDNLLKRFNQLTVLDALQPLYGSKMLATLNYDQLKLDVASFEKLTDDEQCIRLLDNMARRWTDDHQQIEPFRHRIVTRLLNSENPGKDDSLEQIFFATKDVNCKAQYLLTCIDRFSNAKRNMEMIKSVLLEKTVSELTTETRQNLEKYLFHLEVYDQVAAVLDIEDWRTARNLSESNKNLILHQLVQKKQYDLCSRWIQVHPITNDADTVLLDVFTLAVIKASKEDGNCSALLVLIEQMPIDRVVRFYETILLGVKERDIIRHAVKYLEKNGTNQKVYQKYCVSLEIFHHLPSNESEKLWHLISRPLLVIEQYLMNSKLELLSAVIASIRPLLKDNVCQICYEQREYIRDLHLAGRLSGSINLDSSHDDQFLTNECIDCLLRIYAGKALDYRVFGDNGTSGESMHDQSVESYSLDSLCGAFVMPKEVPTRESWVRDEDASHCMCCRRSVFSMLNRRHHCRRCGRVVCHACSKKKLEIPELYEEVPVRACDDCVKQTHKKPSIPVESPGKPSQRYETDQWQLTGNVRNDNIMRDEYSYEYAPSTSQCLAICNLHSQNEELSSFLLYHCAKLEKLLRPILPGYPNPEIDYALVARMLSNLTLAARVRGLQFSEADKMKEHAEIVLSIVSNDCESLLLQEPMSSSNLRKLRDALVMAEKWKLALELSLKCGFATSGVMAAWGTTCLRAGCYETSREKFSHCLQKLSTDTDYSSILSFIESPETNTCNYKQTVLIKRPIRSPPLLLEIISILESTAQAQPPEVIARASVIKSSNTSLSSSIRRKTKNNIPLHEPALNVLNTLSNLKHITKGNFTDFLPEKRALRNRDPAASTSNTSTDYLHALDCIMSTRFFEESMYYLLNYGAHQDIVNFLVKHRQILPAMKYTLTQQVEPEVFLQTVLLPYLKAGKLETVIQVMSSMDETLLVWKNYIIHTCRYLETNRMLNCLYNLQLLLRDPIRASMTCVRFYSMDAKSFAELEANTFHLKNSAAHLQAELELCNWEEISVDSLSDRSETHKSLLMKMEPKELNNHINTILRQLEVTKFLSNCEAKGRDVVGLLPKLFIESSRIPTLFGTVHEKQQLAVLILICGQNIEEGFGLSYRVIQDFNLNNLRVYGLAAKYFMNHSQVENVEKLLQAIASNSSANVDTNSFCDEIIKVSVESAIATHGNSSQVKTALEALIKRVSDVGLKIHCYIVTGQLKTAYLLANKTARMSDIRKILRQAETLNQVHVKRLCETKLAAENGSRK